MDYQDVLDGQQAEHGTDESVVDDRRPDDRAHSPFLMQYDVDMSDVDGLTEEEIETLRGLFWLGTYVM